MHIVSNMPVSVNFLRYTPGKRVRIPVDFINMDQSTDIRRGCTLLRVNKFVECVCDGEIPEKIVIDVSTVSKGDVIRLTSTMLPPRVRPSKTVPLDYVLAVVQSSRG